MARNRDERIDVLCLCNAHGIGGATLNAGMIAVELSRRGLSTSLGFLYERDPTSFHGDVDTFIVADAPPRKLGHWLSFFAKLVLEIRKRRPRAIIGFQPSANLVGAVLAWVSGDCVMVATQRNPSSEQSKFTKLVDRFAGGAGLYRFNIAVSHAVARSFSGYPRRYRERIRVVHNGTPRMSALNDDKSACRRALGVPPGVKALGCLGRLHAQKNLEFAFLVLQTLPDDVHLYLAGSGPEEARLKSCAARLGLGARVRFLGNLTGADIPRFYRAIDVLLFPSLYEGFGRVLVEAFSQGTPVVSSDIEIAREVGGDAALFLPFEVNAWMSGVSKVLMDPEVRESMSKSGLERAERFSIDTMVEEYASLAGFDVCTS